MTGRSHNGEEHDAQETVRIFPADSVDATAAKQTGAQQPFATRPTTPLPTMPQPAAPQSVSPATFDDFAATQGQTAGMVAYGSDRTHVARWNRPANVLIAVIAAIIVAAIILTPIVINQQTKHADALSACQNALSDYRQSRNRLSKLTGNDDGTNRDPAVCSTGDSTESLASTAATLSASASSFNAQAAALQRQQEQDTKKSQTKNDQTEGDESNGSDSGSNESAAEAREALQQSLDTANALLGKVQNSVADGTAKRFVVGTLTTAINGAQQLLNDSGIKDSKYYKAATVTLNEAITAVNDWIDQQAAKAQ